MFNQNISKFIYNFNINKLFIYSISQYIQTDYLTCPNHNLLNIFLTSTTKLLMYSYVNYINKIITKGEKSNSSDFI